MVTLRFGRRGSLPLGLAVALLVAAPATPTEPPEPLELAEPLDRAGPLEGEGAPGPAAADPFSELDFDPVPKLLEARAALDTNDPNAAAELLRELEPSPIGDHAALLRAHALMRAGRRDEAVAALAAGLERDPPTELRAEIEAVLGRLALERSDLPGAYRHFRAAWNGARDTEHAAQLALEVGRAFEERRLPGDALGVYRTTWARWPLTRAGGTAFERSRFLERATGAPPSPAETLFQHAERLRGAYRCGVSLPLYDEALASGKLDAQQLDRAERGRVACLATRRRFPEAVEAYGRLVKAHPAETRLAIELARAHGRGGDRARAARELLQIASRTSGYTRARARYLAALYLEDSAPKRAIELLREVERQKGARSYGRLARWRLAWDDLRASRFVAARQRLERMARGPLSDIEIQRARYWLAKIQLAQGFEAEGRAGLAEIVSAVPLSYYGLISAALLDDPAVLERDLVGERRARPADRGLERAGWLVRGGFPDAARLELYSRLRSGRLGRETRLALAGLLHAVGDHYRALRTVVDGFGATLERGIDARWRDAWEHAWPRPYPRRVHAAAAEFGGEPALVWAIMREESAFRPQVESPVGARGLMQIIPPTGDLIARALGDDGYEVDQLFTEDTNVRFGAWYIRHLLERFSDTRPHAIAAYNAGPDAVQRWLRRDGEQDLDVFVDSVPYGETRRYVRKVMRSFHIYRLLYKGDPEPLLADPAPGPDPAAGGNGAAPAQAPARLANPSKPQERSVR